MKILKAKKRDREINTDVSIAVDILLEPIEEIKKRMDRIENLLANILLESEPEQSNIINIRR